MITWKIGVLIGVCSFVIGELVGIFAIAMCSANHNNKRELDIYGDNNKGVDDVK